MCSIVVNRVPNKVNTVYGANVIIFEGIFGLYDKKVLEMMVSVLDPSSPSLLQRMDSGEMQTPYFWIRLLIVDAQTSLGNEPITRT